MQVIKFSDFMNKNYDKIANTNNDGSFGEVVKTIFIAMLIVYFSPYIFDVVYQVFIGIKGM